MEYVYAVLVLHEAEAEINEENMTAVLEAAGVDVEESRVKATVAALEDVDVEEAVEQAAAVPAGGAAAGGAAAGGDEDGDEAPEESDEEEAAGDDEEPEEVDDEEAEEAAGEGLGDLFG